jgi:hypothetical protein
MRSTIEQHGGECGIAREAKHRRYPIICSGPGSSTIRVRNPANENNQYVDPKKCRSCLSNNRPPQFGFLGEPRVNVMGLNRLLNPLS